MLGAATAAWFGGSADSGGLVSLIAVDKTLSGKDYSSKQRHLELEPPEVRTTSKFLLNAGKALYFPSNKGNWVVQVGLKPSREAGRSHNFPLMPTSSKFVPDWPRSPTTWQIGIPDSLQMD
ncbi:MAG: hypothetical protein ACKOAH_25910, partial [Pirellula sp.]